MEYTKLFQNRSQYDTFMSTWIDINSNVSYCIQEKEMHYNQKHNYSKDYLTFVALEDETFKFNGNIMQYSLDNGTTWTSLASNTASPTVTAGNKIMWKKTGLTPTSSAGIGTFSSTGQFNVQGNIMSLHFGNDFIEQTSLSGKDYAFYKLFNNCTKIISAENLILPATTLANSCYANMFYGCTNLTAAPKLPATTLTSSCYSLMFRNCSSLTVAPKLPATTLASSCYANMFNGCTSITIAPELPATTLANYCYSCMFQSCKGLTSAPELPATTLVESCYAYMFAYCTSLTTAPELPAITLVNGCYSYMFNGCTKLNYIKAMFTTTPSNTYTTYWLQNVCSGGTFIMNRAANWNVHGSNGIPTNWAIQYASN